MICLLVRCRRWLGTGVPLLLLASNSLAGNLRINVVNPLEKVFRDTVLAPSREDPIIGLECAANEFESAQFVLRSDEAIQDLRVVLGSLRNRVSGASIGVENLQWHFVGFVPVARNTTEARCGAHRDIPQGELLRTAPFDCPDPLLEKRQLDIDGNVSQPVWITAYAPKGTAPGTYRGEVSVRTSQTKVNIPIELTVYPFELPDERHLYLTQWFQINHIAAAHKVEPLSDEFWPVLERYAENLAQHRQNVIYTPWRLIKVFREKNGEITFDYQDFDRFVDTFLQAGSADRIEIQHIAHHGPEGRRGKEVPLYTVDPIDRESGEKVSLPGNEGMKALLQDLHRHLVEKGWLERTIIHVSDEPSFHNAEQWKAAARFVKTNLPGVKTIDAIEATGFDDTLDILVPQTVNLYTWFTDFKKAQQAGSELWFYTCCSPWGYYANRFLDYHLSKTRILHWMNYATGTQGFLHWGLTYGWEDPFGPAPRYPPGDSHIIYPGTEGPMSSIRWEMLREGLEDYEYLWMLASKTRKLMETMGIASDRFPADSRSQEICGKLVRSLVDYETDPDTFYAVRRLLASEISELETTPRILMATSPNSSTQFTVGPAMTKVFGFVEAGSRLAINGEPAEINPVDGSFVKKIRLSWSEQELTVEVQRGEAVKVLKRRFHIR